MSGGEAHRPSIPPGDATLRPAVQTSIDVDGCTGNVAALVRAEERDDAGDVVGLPETAERDGLEERPVLLGRPAAPGDLRHALRVDEAGGDRVGGDAMGTELQGQCLGQAD